MKAQKRSTERRSGVDPVAARVGERIRAARLAAGLTQQQLAGDRYTKAYVSALENAHVKPSMAALDYLAGRLGTTASRLIASEDPQWGRLDADLQLAAGRWQAAADAYSALLETTLDRTQRAEQLRGLAEAQVRLGKFAEAERTASESAALLEQLGRADEAAQASYWLSAALNGQESTAEAKAILQAITGRVRAGLEVPPAFRLRLVMALATSEAREGNHDVALGYLEEIRELAETLDDRRRAGYLFDLAYSYRATGDYESALKAGYASLELFNSMAADTEVARTENDLALAHLALGNASRAELLTASARRRLEDLGDEASLSQVLETEAQIAGARDAWSLALRLAAEAYELADRTGNSNAAVNALLTTARARAAAGESQAALDAYERAGRLARELGWPSVIRRTLGAWAEALAQSGDHAGAYSLTREALGAG